MVAVLSPYNCFLKKKKDQSVIFMSIKIENRLSVRSVQKYKGAPEYLGW